jgi:hypothetical protein
VEKSNIRLGGHQRAGNLRAMDGLGDLWLLAAQDAQRLRQPHQLLSAEEAIAKDCFSGCGARLHPRH